MDLLGNCHNSCCEMKTEDEDEEPAGAFTTVTYSGQDLYYAGSGQLAAPCDSTYGEIFDFILSAPISDSLSPQGFTFYPTEENVKVTSFTFHITSWGTYTGSGTMQLLYDTTALPVPGMPVVELGGALTQTFTNLDVSLIKDERIYCVYDVDVDVGSGPFSIDLIVEAPPGIYCNYVVSPEHPSPFPPENTLTKVVKRTTQTIPSGESNPVLFESTVIEFGLDFNYDPLTGAFTIPLAGVYVFLGSVFFNETSGSRAAFFSVNDIIGTTLQYGRADVDSTSGTRCALVPSTVMDLKVGDKVYLLAFSENGAIVGGTEHWKMCEMAIRFLYDTSDQLP